MTGQDSRAQSQAGFSLLEILVALLLVGLIYTSLNTDTFTTERQKVDEALTDFERALRFSIDEAALKNAIVRLHLYLDKSPQEYAVEYGPNAHFVLPSQLFLDEEAQNLKEQEAIDKEKKELDQKFNRVRELNDQNKIINEDLLILGMANSNSKKLITQGDPSIYVYPTGERDQAIIILSSSQEVVAIKINAFVVEFNREYIPLAQAGEEFPEGSELDNKREALAKEIFEKWKKEQ